MKKNGFTLIELLAVLIIIMLLLTITIPILSGRINEGRAKATSTQIKNIEYAAKKYVTDNIRELDELNKFGFINITLEELMEKKYIDVNLVNPSTKTTLLIDDVVYVTLDSNNKINVIYDIDQKSKATITLKGFYNEKIKLNSVYSDPGAIGFDGVNTDPDKKADNIDIIDTSKEGVYILKYHYGNSRIIERNVIVQE